MPSSLTSVGRGTILPREEFRAPLETEMSTPPTTATTFLDPTLGRTFRIWWAWFWRWVLFWLASAIVLNLPIAGVALLLGGTQRIASYVSAVAASMALVAAQIYTLWNILDKRFGEFEVRVQDISATTPSIPAGTFIAATLGQAFKVWWAWFWRSLVWGFLCTLPVGFFGQFVTRFVRWPETVYMSITFATVNVVWLLASVYVLKRILQRDFRRFRIRLVSTTEGEGLSLL